MVNVTVVSAKTILKYLAVAGTLVVFVIASKNIFSGKEKQTQGENEWKVSFLSCIQNTLPDIQKKSQMYQIEEEQKKISSRSSSLRKMLQLQLPMMDTLIEDGEEEGIQPPQQQENTKQEMAQADVDTKEITEHNITPKYNTVYGSVKIKNESDKTITEDMLTPNISLEDKKDVVIFHTHTCESYTPSEKYNYEMTGSYRTTDLNFSVARVGTELENQLNQYGFHVTHDQTYHDYPEYTGSYGRSLETVKSILKTQADTQMVIDLHRDAIGSMEDYAPSVQIGDETAAQMMFVIGTDGGGLQHLNWQQNLKFAIKVQQKANELYPGLFRPIIVRNSRYNQHLTKAATLIEVGATGNTLDQCLVSMKYLAKVLYEVNQ